MSLRYPKKQYGVQNKYDPNDTEWYDTKAEQERGLDEANTYILVECEVEEDRP